MPGVFREAAALNEDVVSIFRQEHDRTRRRQSAELDNTLVEELIRQQNELKKFRGKDALNQGDRIRDEYQQFFDKLSGGVSDPLVQAAFRQSFLNRSQSLNAFSTSYESRQLDIEAIETFGAAQQNLHQLALSGAQDDLDNGVPVDQDKVRDAINERAAALGDFARDNGKSAEWFQARLEEMVSTTHRDVLNLLLAEEQDLSAREYLSIHRDEMSAKHVIEALSNTQEGSSRGEAARLADLILTKAQGADEDISSASVRRDMLAQARKQAKSDKEFQRVRALLLQRFGDDDAFDKQELGELYEESITLMRQNPGIPPGRLINPDKWEKLGSDAQGALNKIFSAPPSATPFSNAVWLDFQRTARTNKGKVADWDIREFQVKVWSHLPPSQRERANKIWLASKEKDPSDYINLINPSEQVDRLFREKLGLGGKKLGPAQEAQLIRLEERAQRAFDDFSDKKNRKPDREEREKIIRDDLDRVVYIPSFWSFFGADPSETLVVNLTEDERGNVRIPFDVLSVKEQDLFRKRLEGAKLNVEGEPGKKLIERLAGAVYSADAQLVRDILSGKSQ